MSSRRPSPLSKADLSPAAPSPAFICTICWQPQPPPSRPKTLGASARIVCRPCWRAVLDLSICWVCGECITRGDEAISLGWCFWHRACFGCLVCCCRMPLPREVLDRGRGRDGAVELNVVPLCGGCEIDTEGETQGGLVERGLMTVDKFDGGLSRCRRDMLRDGGVREGRDSKRMLLPGGRRGIDGAYDASERVDNHPRESPDIGISDGCCDLDRAPCNYDTEMVDLRPCTPETRPEIYVSIFNPVGEPAFRPSSTKPLPKWMQLLPSNVDKQKELRTRDAKCEHHSHAHELEPLGGQPCPDSCNHARNPSDDAQKKSTRSSSHLSCARSSPSPSAPIDIPGRTQRQGVVTTSDSKAKGATYFKHSRAYTSSQTNESSSIAYTTPPEYPPTLFPIPPRQKSPHPHLRARKQTFERNPTPSPYFSHRRDITNSETPTMPGSFSWASEKPSHPDPETPRSPSPTDTRPSISEPPKPPFLTSAPPPPAEYMNKYRPAGQNEKYVAVTKEPHHPPILEQIRRRRQEKGGVAAQDQRGTRGSGSGCFGVGVGVERRWENNMRDELRGVFAGGGAGGGR